MTQAYAILESKIYTNRVPIIENNVVVGWEPYGTFNEDVYYDHNIETYFNTKEEAEDFLKKYAEHDCPKCSKKIIEKIKIGTLPWGGLWWNKI